MARVFVSHKNTDSAVAGGVALRLKENGLDVYIDVIDSALGKDGPELGDYLRERMSECTQLMAVVSLATKESWWVPWEIGIATEKNFFIATYAAQQTELPGYLQKWPYLRSARDIDEYARLSKEAEGDLRQKSRTYGVTESLRASSARNFHRRLKTRLGQTY